jgi:hypothetical protein
VDIPASQLYDSGTYSPLRVGETVYVASSNIAGIVVGVASVSQCTIRPKKSTEAFVSAGSANLLAGEVLIFGGLTDVGEASSERDPQTHLDVRYDNNVTAIREDYAATDFAEMSEVWYDSGVSGTALNGVNQSGNSYFTYKALVKTDRRFLNSIESRLMRGDQVTNTGLPNSPTTGTQGFIPKITADGETVNYTSGTLDIAKLHQITRIMDVNGCAKETFGYKTFTKDKTLAMVFLKNILPELRVWGQNEKSEQAMINYGVQSISIDGYMLRVKKYSPFNSEVQVGLTPNVDFFRDYGVIAPMGSVPDAKPTPT